MGCCLHNFADQSEAHILVAVHFTGLGYQVEVAQITDERIYRCILIYQVCKGMIGQPFGVRKNMTQLQFLCSLFRFQFEVR